MSTSTAVLPFFRANRYARYWTYHCRSCDWVWRAAALLTRDLRMVVLAQHLADAHRTGPLMAGRANQEAIG